jgi:hypothetical protein
MKKSILFAALILSIAGLTSATAISQQGCTTTPNPPPGCTAPTCVCDPDGNNCHWIYICPGGTAR